MPSQSQRSSKLFSGSDATAFASILVVLLFVVLIAEGMTYNPHHGVSADLPKVMHPVPMPGALGQDVMQVCIMRDGKVYFGVERIDAFTLQAKVEDRLRDRGVERKVYIIVDQRASVGHGQASPGCRTLGWSYQSCISGRSALGSNPYAVAMRAGLRPFGCSALSGQTLAGQPRGLSLREPLFYEFRARFLIQIGVPTKPKAARI
jgi:biopolymer transport protein ExbD